MKGYWQYINDIESGKIKSGELIKKAVSRFRKLLNRDDIYLDENTVDDAIDFISNIKHFLGKSCGKHFHLENWQQFILANILGLKWKSNNNRCCRESYIQIARKAGKDAFMAALALYMLIADGEASPEIACLANSRDQANILFNYITNFAKSLDPRGNSIDFYRNFIKFSTTNGICKVFSADASKLDGLNVSLGIIDEYHQAKDRKLYDVIKSSMAMRVQPLMIVITTAGFNLESPCYDMYSLSVEVLNEIKQDDSFFPFIFSLDADDDWTNPDNFIKVQPNLGITVGEDFMISEVNKAKNDATAEVGIKTKTFNMWCQSFETWIPQEIIAKTMKPVNINDYAGYICFIGVDLSSVSDFTSLSVLIPVEDKFIYKTWCFLPKETLKTSPNKELYSKFIQEKTMIPTSGNVTDYDYVINKIQELNKILNIQGIYYDQWNSTSWAIKCTELGFNMQPYSQSIGNFNEPTKALERQIRDNKAIIDKSSCVLWQFGNVEIKLDHNGNCKPNKDSNSKKIDSTISMITALGGYLKNPVATDFDLFIL